MHTRDQGQTTARQGVTRLTLTTDAPFVRRDCKLGRWIKKETSEQTSVTKGDFEDDNSEANNKDSIYNTDTTWQAAKWSTAPYQKLIGELAYGD